MSEVQFRRMAEKLGLRLSLLWDPTKPETSFMTVHKAAGGTLSLESYDSKKPLACILDAQGVTL